MKPVPDRFEDETASEDGFYSRKARRNDEDIDKFIRLLRSIGELLGLSTFWKWITR